MKTLETSLVIAIAAGGVAATIAYASIFDFARQWATRRSHHLWILLRCPYCIAHWLVFAAVAAYRPCLVHSGMVALDLIVSAFAIVSTATLVTAILRRLYWG